MQQLMEQTGSTGSIDDKTKYVLFFLLVLYVVLLLFSFKNEPVQFIIYAVFLKNPTTGEGLVLLQENES